MEEDSMSDDVEARLQQGYVDMPSAPTTS